MAGIEDQINPAIPVGAQPSQVTSQPIPGQAPDIGPVPPGPRMPGGAPPPPAAAPAQSPEQTLGQAQGQQAAQQSQAAQQDPDVQKTNSDVDDLFSHFEKRDPKLAAAGDRQVAAQVDQQDLFSHFDKKGEAPDQYDPNMPAYQRRANKPGESLWDGFMREASEPVKFLAAKMRQNLGRNPNEQAAAFKSMYGDGNVKLKDDVLYFRPEAGAKFRKVDQGMFGGIADMVIMNTLKVPGLVANAAATIGTEASITGATGGAGALPGAAVAFAAGGAADAATNHLMIKGLDQISSQPQADPDIDVQSEILKSAGLNAAVGLAGKAVASTNLAQKAVAKFRGLFQELSPVETAQVDAGPTISGLAQVRTAFKEFRQALFPSVGSTPEATGKAVGSAMDAVHVNLTQNVEAVKEQALGMASQKGIRATADNTLSELKSILKEQGIPFTKEGYTDSEMMSLRDTLGTENAFGSPGGRNTLEYLMKYHDEMQLLNQSEKGVQAAKLFNDTQSFQTMSKFDQAANNRPDAELAVFRRLQHASGADRNQLIKEALDGSGLPEEKFYKDAYQKFTQNIDAVTQFKAAFHNDQSREKMVQTFYGSNSAQKLEMLDNIKTTLGDGSKEWNALRGDLVDHAVGMHTNQGVLNAPKFVQYLNSPKSNGLLNRILSPDERKVLSQMAVESTRVPVGDALTVNQQHGITNVAQLFTKLAVSGKHALMHILPFLGQDKKAVDYLLNDGFLQTLKAAEGPAQRKKIMEAMSLGNEAVSRMRIVQVPMTLKNGNKVFVERYAPVMTGPASRGANSLMGMVGGAPAPTNVPEATPEAPPAEDTQQLAAP